MRKGEIEAMVRPRRQQRAWVYALGAATGMVAGAVAVAYRAIGSWLGGLREHSFAWASRPATLDIAVWIFLCASAGAATAWLVRVFPLIKGSGIPQVKAALMRRLPLDWRHDLPGKFVGGSLAMGAGLSLGREGPSIQLGALTGAALGDIVRKPELKRYLVTAGAAAGIAAAFNAPLAGVLFCLEELHRSFSPVMLTCSMIAAVAANVISGIVLGESNVFAFDIARTLPLGLYPLLIAVGVACGLVGALFNNLLLGAQRLMARIIPREGPKVVIAFVLGGLVAAVLPALAGGGHALVDSAVREGRPLAFLSALAVGKLVFTLLCYGSGAPGGIFLPMLSIGALLGCSFGRALGFVGLPAGYDANFAILGMVGFFTAVVRAPITGAILVTEMTGSLGHFPALILVSIVASLTAAIARSEPIYDSLLRRLLAQGSGEGPREGDGASVLHVPVFEGSVIDRCEEVQACMPDGCVLVGVLRGESEILPRAGLDIWPGDVLLVLTEEKEARGARERLTALAAPHPKDLESGE